MMKQVLIVGGGIGGLAAALACTRAGWQVRLYEQAGQFSEVGAGIQLGPNATRILSAAGLGDALARVAAFPRQLKVRSAVDGAQLGALRLGSTIAERWGAPYVTVHRADLQGLLLAATRGSGAQLKLSSPVTRLEAAVDAVCVRLPGDVEVEGDALVGADGLWSAVRGQVWADAPPAFTGHLAYRGLVMQRDLPEALRSQDVTAWLGPHMHLVAYPVRGGDQLNVVVLVEGAMSEPSLVRNWDQAGVAADLHAAMGSLCGQLRDLVQAIPQWRMWALHDRAPVAGPHQMASGRVALLGDAAHPMRPYFAQGAGMALEDAAELGRALTMAADGTIDVPLALRRYALNRWQRCARVQALSRRNGRVFHATGLVQWARNLSMRVLGERLLDQPWLYRA